MPEHKLEATAQAIPQEDQLRSYMEHTASAPHHAGSPGSKAVADYLVTQFKSWGLDARIESFEALLPYPTTRSLEMIAPVRFKAALTEGPIANDPDTNDKGQLPTFNAYSASGDVVGQLVYVNYGTPEDYAYLKAHNIDVRGKVVVARYGRTWRGIKAKLAQEAGAVACIIYSDPRDDGFYSEDSYPQGSTRPSQGVQRGSVVDMPLYPGDPLSPGFASEIGQTNGPMRLTREEAPTILKIPVMPISWADARPLLEQLRGPLAPETWRGALPITYHVGPGPATVHLKLDFDWTNKPVHNVIVTIPGTTEKDQWVLYGNHHDAWVNGASDPGSGSSVVIETARVLSELLKQGWRPKRTIMLALWDGEEFGLVGSTEWVEKHQKELREHAVVYLNSDSTGTGPFSLGGSPSLDVFMQEVLRDVRDPRTTGPQTAIATSATAAIASNATQSIPETHVGPLGAGSDYVAFLDHAGIASLHMGFGAAIGQYHSAYDTTRYFERFQDGDRRFSIALTQVMTTALLRISNANVLPFEFQTLSQSIRRYLDEVRRQIPQGSGPSAVDLTEVTAQVNRLSAAAQQYDNTFASRFNTMLETQPLPAAAALKVNQAVRQLEQTLLLDDGLPGRPWYRHQLFAPGMSTGYAAVTIPGVREAVDDHRWTEANQQSRRLAQALAAATTVIEQATALLQ
jgi:N-acetylated-alpha-linked acidic dipeptidase